MKRRAKGLAILAAAIATIGALAIWAESAQAASRPTSSTGQVLTLSDPENASSQGLCVPITRQTFEHWILHVDEVTGIPQMFEVRVYKLRVWIPVSSPTDWCDPPEWVYSHTFWQDFHGSG